jgi:hypothetical protein
MKFAFSCKALMLKMKYRESEGVSRACEQVQNMVNARLECGEVRVTIGKKA